MENNDILLTVSEVAEQLKLSSMTVRNYLRRGDLEGIKIGRRQWRIRVSSLNELLGKTNKATFTHTPIYGNINEFLAQRKDNIAYKRPKGGV